MKKLGLILLMFVLGMGFSSNAYAITIIATINPFWGGSYTPNSTSGTARIDFYSDIAFDAGSLDFDTSNGVFFVSGTEAIITPIGWTVTPSNGFLGFQLIGNGGSPTTTNHLAFEFDFTLSKSLNQMATEVINGTAPDGWKTFFSSNEPWSMNGSIGLNGSTASFSTTVIPEPGTVMLLGFGLLGLGFFTRRRRSDS